MIDPFGSVDALRRRVQFDYPPITGVSADLESSEVDVDAQPEGVVVLDPPLP